MMGLRIVKVELSDANAFVAKLHRHHDPVVGHKFSIGVRDDDGILRGVAIIGRPVARRLDDGVTLEVTRLCTDGTKNACSILYASASRAAEAMGYERIVTYILATESGTSLIASGWIKEIETRGASWSVPSRPRGKGKNLFGESAKDTTGAKTRYGKSFMKSEAISGKEPTP